MIVCNEMKALRQMLDDKGIKWHDMSEDYKAGLSRPLWMARTKFEIKGYNISVINGFGSYGGFRHTQDANPGLLEMMISNEEPIGYLRADDVIKVLTERFGGIE